VPWRSGGSGRHRCRRNGAAAGYPIGAGTTRTAARARRQYRQAGRLLEGAVEPNYGDRRERQPWAVTIPWSTERLPRIPAGLTLKAVSRRTGIPAATLRTSERRYGFARPMRSANGYRLYGEEEIARVL
jgi:MerR HTH family regulatory protein